MTIQSQFLPNSFQVPNIVIDNVMHQLSSTQFKLYMFVYRHTYGFRDNTDRKRALSLSTFLDGYTSKKGYKFNGVGVSKPTLVSNLKQLVKAGWLNKEKSETADVWSINLEPVGGKETLPVVVKKLYRGGKETLPVGGKETLPNEITVLVKDNSKDNKEVSDIKMSGQIPKDAFQVSNQKLLPATIPEIDSLTEETKQVEKTEHELIVDCIKAWDSAQTFPAMGQGNIYGHRYNRNVMKDILKLGATAEDVKAFTEQKGQHKHVTMYMVSNDFFKWWSDKKQSEVVPLVADKPIERYPGWKQEDIDEHEQEWDDLYKLFGDK